LLGVRVEPCRDARQVFVAFAYVLRRHRFLAFLALSACGLAVPARAGTWLQPDGSGLVIASIGFSEGTRRFDGGGQAVPAPAYNKMAVSGYLEYGLTTAVTVIAAPTLARENGIATNAVTGSSSSAFGARLGLYAAPTRVVSLQVLVQPTLAPGSRTAQIAADGARNLAVDVRLMGAQSFTLFGAPAFVDVAPGARVRADPFPSEARLDVTFGIRPLPQWLVLVQSFGSWAPPAGPLVPRTAYDKLQASLVYDLSPRWSVQLGAFRTVVGENMVREAGPTGAVWYRF
jgi:protein XagA